MFTNTPSDKSIANYKALTSPNTKSINSKKLSTSKEAVVFIAPKIVAKNQSLINLSTGLPANIINANHGKDEAAPPDNNDNYLRTPNDNVTEKDKVDEDELAFNNEEHFSEQLSITRQSTVSKPEATSNKKSPVKTPVIGKTDNNISPSSLINNNTTITTSNEIAIGDIPKKIQVEETNKLKTENSPLITANTQSAITDMTPYGIESVSNSYIKLAKRKKATWQIYFTPTVTYRSLKENQAFIKAARLATNPINQTSPSPSAITYNLAELEHVVTHKADLGFQLGTSVSHPLSRKLRLVTGFQFNVNKYDIKAYGHTTEVATISLNTLGRRSSVSTVTSYRVIGSGYNVNWLRNFYFSASVPIGLEYVVARGKRSYVGVAANVQPTYVLDNKSYLVSTDYKNYAQVPSLTRHWNINTGAEIFAGIVNKKSEWRISPQVRYQTLSSYKNTYPVKENLFDVGVKLGLILK
jgi:hypothetical protein